MPPDLATNSYGARSEHVLVGIEGGNEVYGRELMGGCPTTLGGALA